MIITVYKLLVEHEGEFVPALNEQGEQMQFEAIDPAEAGEYLPPCRPKMASASVLKRSVNTKFLILLMLLTASNSHSITGGMA